MDLSGANGSGPAFEPACLRKACKMPPCSDQETVLRSSHSPVQRHALPRGWFSLSLFASGLVGAVSLLSSATARADDPQARTATPAEIEFFESKIRPLLVEHCQECHSDKKQKGGLRLDQRSFLMTGGDSGPAIDLKQPDKSLLLEVLSYTGDYQMPPKGKLPDAEIALIQDWVRKGSPWPDEAKKKPGTTKEEFNLQARLSRQWAMQPLQPQNPPAVKNAAWSRTPTDQFVLAKLEAAGLQPAPAADRRTWIRRVTFDLIGLPPTPEEIAAFLSDASPQAFERVIDRLLESPHYGEKWARHWLDLARFAETAGHEFDFEYPYAFEYRDYVIRAFNADLPYNQFVREQIAGDLLPQPRRHPTEQFNESLIGTGFWFLGEAKHSPVDIRQDEADRIDNQIDVFGKTFLGLSINCSRCHDHKFDAISTRDYYSLCGFVQSSRYQTACVDPSSLNQPALEELAKLDQESTALSRRTLSQWLKNQEPKKETGTSTLESLLLTVVELQAVTDAGQQQQALQQKAAQRGLPVEQVQAWRDLVRDQVKSPDHPLFPLIAVGRQNPAQTLAQIEADRQAAAKVPATEVAATALKPGEIANPIGTAIAANSQPPVVAPAPLAVSPGLLWDFRQGVPADWYVTGDAFTVAQSRPGRSAGGSLLVATRPGSRLESISAGTVHSGRAALTLQGTLRSPTFTIASPFLLYRIAGTGTRINLIIDGFQQIRYPIYGGLTIQPAKPDEFDWLIMDVSKWVGHRAYIELLDESDGFLAITEIHAQADRQLPDRRARWTDLLGAKAALPAADDPQFQSRLVQQVVQQLHATVQQQLDQPDAPAESIGASSWISWLVQTPLAGLPGQELTASPLSADVMALTQRRAQAAGRIAYRRKVMALADGTAEDERVHLRGNHKKLGDATPRRFLEAFVGAGPQKTAIGSGRLELAERMTDPQITPLVPRVVVNRIWQHLFGRGLVPTPDDFGNMGQAATHPELLEYLTAEFVADGWSIKRLQKRLLLSQTFGMSSRNDDPRAAEVDANNRLWHRMQIRRLDAEAIRDSLLAVSGSLNPALYGRSVPPHLTAFMIGRGRPGNSGPLDGENRRTIYLNVRRNFLNPMLMAFDYPVPFSSIGRRSQSNVPAQALTMLNNPFVLQQAERWAQKILAQPGEPAARIQRMYETAFGRPPTDNELTISVAYLTEQKAAPGSPEELAAYAGLAHVLLNVKEFLFVQ